MKSSISPVTSLLNQADGIRDRILMLRQSEAGTSLVPREMTPQYPRARRILTAVSLPVTCTSISVLHLVPADPKLFSVDLRNAIKQEYHIIQQEV